nr:immunoglobulin heavy chain junction region [Macaca mulatta]MOY24589.1 immunoglobulin heavy chain junction region [Macaca mulatta]MOY25662.1 immunoglobulin heavy chain junction region [Macaca mulatta]MOY30579.1 immunoglobulin heavy chain junction region [Macaca mulatta]
CAREGSYGNTPNGEYFEFW